MTAKRLVDLLLLAVVAPVALPVALLVAIAVRVSSPGPALYWSQRVGRGNVLFAMPKFRTMRMGTPVVATHLLADAHSVLTPIGGLLRATSLDEIPQLWSVLIGDMSFVGPRPALFNQDDLIALRTQGGVQQLRPGITGWAQVNGRDTLSIPDKVAMDEVYLRQHTIGFDLRILAMTAGRVVSKHGISH